MVWLMSMVVAYLIAVTLMVLFQRRLIYHPRKNVLPIAEYGLPDATEINLTAADGTGLHGWLMPAREGRPTIVYFHGNFDHLGRRAERFRHFAAAGFGVVAIHYRGYGASKGRPSEIGIYTDAKAAMIFATDMLDLPPERLILYGESLGSGVAVQMATEWPVGLLVLEAPYLSVARRSGEIFRWLPARFLIWDKYETFKKIRGITMPLLVFHNESDRIIPIRHGRELFAMAPEPKRAFWLHGEHHTHFEWAEVTREIARAWDEGIQSSSAPV